MTSVVSYAARGIVDVWPMFCWMLILLIFLVSGLIHAPMELTPPQSS